MEAVLAQTHYCCRSSSSSSRSRDCVNSNAELSSAFLAPRVFSPSPSPPYLPKPSLLLVVRAGKGKRPRFATGGPQQRVPSIPKLEDDGNPKFVIFVRDKSVPLWFPLNIVTGGSLAKMVVGAMGNEWGRKMAQGTLTRDLGNAIYKDEKSLRMTATRTHSMLRDVKELEYGYKVVNMNDQKTAFMPTNVIKIPPKEELKTVADKVKDFVGDSVSGVKDTFKGLMGGEQSKEDSK